MNKKNTSLLLLLLALVCSCQKCPTTDQLQGAWTEVTNAADKSKLIFQGDRLYFFHTPSIDTFSYTFDTKHCTLNLTLLKNSTPTAISSKGCDVQYHKKNKIMNVWGLFPPVSGSESVTNYKL